MVEEYCVMCDYEKNYCIKFSFNLTISKFDNKALKTYGMTIGDNRLNQISISNNNIK